MVRFNYTNKAKLLLCKLWQGSQGDNGGICGMGNQSDSTKRKNLGGQGAQGHTNCRTLLCASSVGQCRLWWNY